MSQTAEPDEDEGRGTSKLEGQGIRWVFSMKKNGDCVIRNGDLSRRAAMWLCGILIGEITFLIIWLLAINNYNGVPHGNPPSTTAYSLAFIVLFLFFGGPIAVWKLYHEWKGVLVTRQIITYPLRLGHYGIFPYGRRTVRMSLVATASPEPVHEGPYKYSHLVALAGDFGAAKIFFENKNGRDRLLAILKTRFPKVRGYRRV
jgi:hypothetical protein